MVQKSYSSPSFSNYTPPSNYRPSAYTRSMATSLFLNPSSSSYVIAAPVTLARSSISVFTHSPRGYLPPDRFVRPSSYATSPAGVVGRTPYYTDRYPYVKYSGYSAGPYAARGNLADATAAKYWPNKIAPSYGRSSSNKILSSSRSYTKLASDLFTPMNSGRKRLYSDDVTSEYFLGRNGSSSSSSSYYSTRMGVEGALDMYKKRFLTVGQLSKYWLTPGIAEYRRLKDVKASMGPYYYSGSAASAISPAYLSKYPKTASTYAYKLSGY